MVFSIDISFSLTHKYTCALVFPDSPVQETSHKLQCVTCKAVNGANLSVVLCARMLVQHNSDLITEFVHVAS